MKGAKQLSRLAALVLLFVLPVSASWAAYTLKYNTLRVGRDDGVVRVALDLSGPTTLKYFSLPKPNRFVVDLSDIIRTGSRPDVDFSNTPISAIRAGIRHGRDIRLVLELSDAVQAKAYLLPSANGHGQRLVIELAGGEVAKRSEPVSVAKVSAPAPVAKVDPPSPPVVTAAPAVPVIQKSEPVEPPVVKKEVVDNEQERDVVIAIDAGHGGADVGAIGSKGTYEKDVTLQIARQLEERVRKEPGMVPLMIRDGDYFVSLRDRVKKARAYKADMFISIHADSFPDKRAKGSSVYALSQRGATNEAARMLADRENSADLIGGVSLDDKDALLASVLLDLSQNATIEASLDVAGRVLKGLKHVGRIHKHHVEQAGFVVLKSPDIPSILVETAFISNPSEETNLQSTTYQTKLADAIMKGVHSYFVSNPPEGSHIAAREHVIKRGETLSGIANQYNISARALRVTNNLKDDTLRIGQILQIPLSDT